MTAKFSNPLDKIKIASPCSQEWDAMVGSDRKRYCGECKLNVYNLSGMTRRDAENLLLNAEGRVCVRYFRRKDGTVITKDCPVGWKAIKRRVSKTATAFASLIFAALGGIGITSFVTQASGEDHTVGVVAVGEVKTEKEIELMGAMIYEEPEEPVAIMGEIAYPNEPISGNIANFDEVKRQIIEREEN